MGHLAVVFGSQGWMECRTSRQGPVDQNGTGTRADHQSTGDTLALLPRSEGGVVDRGDLSSRNSPLTVLVFDRVGVLDGLPRAVIDRSDGLLDPRIYLGGDRHVAAPVMAALMGRGHHMLNRRASRSVPPDMAYIRPTVASASLTSRATPRREQGGLVVGV